MWPLGTAWALFPIAAATDNPSYQFAVSGAFKSLVTSIALARFIVHDELVPAFTASALMGREFAIKR
jgi:hypothetical protein